MKNGKSLTDNFKSRDASASKNVLYDFLICDNAKHFLTSIFSNRGYSELKLLPSDWLQCVSLCRFQVLPFHKFYKLLRVVYAFQLKSGFDVLGWANVLPFILFELYVVSFTVLGWANVLPPILFESYVVSFSVFDERGTI